MYCKSNVRRVINYTQNEPINKYDLWLSENARYNEEGQLKYDNDGQPACDLILKIFRKGKWEPIVGYNTTAANKINIVPGNTNYHPAIFTGSNPNDLQDCGSLGELLSNENFVNENEWGDVFNSSQFHNSFTHNVINNNSYPWSQFITEIIQEGDVNITQAIDYAGYRKKGGIWADMFSLGD